MITIEQKKKVIEAIKSQSINYGSRAKQAKAIGINAAQLSQLINGKIDKVISETNWIIIAGKVGVSLKKGDAWKTAKTEAFQIISEQLDFCQQASVSGILCDLPDVGKTHTAKIYVRQNKHAIYIDCSQVKTRQRLVRKIAKEFGVDDTGGRYADVYEGLVYYLCGIEKPLVILDEAGDLKPDAFLELKALWNATERSCGWYLMGADGLRVRMEHGQAAKKVGFSELYRRLGSRYQQISPEGREALQEFKKSQFLMVAKANGLPTTKELYVKSNGSLERARVEFEKQKLA